MTQSNTASERIEGEATGAPGTPGVGDPWGIKRAENLITSLTGVLSARVVATPLGEVEEVHVLTTGEIQPKQVVRNIESALMAHLGLKIDHRKISVAQTAEVKPLDAMMADAAHHRGMLRASVFQQLTLLPAERPQRVRVHVRLQFRDREGVAEAEGTDTMSGRLEASARAAASAVEDILEGHSLALMGVKEVEAVDRRFVLAVVQGLGGREAATLTGTCEVRDSVERAAALAVLDATNRWADARRG